MNEDTLMKLVDKLAGKLGVAAESLTPLAEEAVRQVQLRGMVYCLAGGAVFLVGLLVAGLAYRLFRAAGAKDCGYGEEGLVVGGIVAAVLAVIAFPLGLGFFFEGLCLWLAPLPSVLGL